MENNDYRSEVERWCAHMKIICVEVLESYNAILECEKHGVLKNQHTRFVLFRSMGSYITIRVCAFIEEYNHVFINDDDGDLSEAVLSFKVICQPIIDSIQEWTDLKKYRNHVIAHSFRAKTKRTKHSILLEMNKYNVPKTVDDLHFLCECMNMIDSKLDGFEKVFGEDFYIKGLDSPNEDVPPRINAENRFQIINDLRAKVDEIVGRLKRDVT